ncbi:DUF4224 domain-containing protein, partial [Kingella kingae]
ARLASSPTNRPNAPTTGVNKMQTDTFLNRAELHDLTGYKNPSKQREILKQQGIPFYINARGYPIVCREQLISNKKQPAPKPPTWQPKIQA